MGCKNIEFRVPTIAVFYCAILWLGSMVNVHASDPSELIITESTTLDPDRNYSRIIIKASNITVDGNGAWLIGKTEGKPSEYQGTAVVAHGVSGVTLKNIHAKGWGTGLHVTDGSDWLVEGCDFSNNFHDPDFGWGENGRRGGIVLERVSTSVLRNNQANQVWDGCVLVDSNNNVLSENDFSHTSNTCLKLWTSCGNTIRNNKLSHGIRISPGEVHARDSTCVLIESGSCGNKLIGNDCTYGGDGIFVRVLNGWCSTDNHFVGNDCSYANNNGVECWAPRNTFERNKANHCSYGFWLGGSDQSRLIENEASYNGLATGAHNYPHQPHQGHPGNVFMFGSSSHTLARGNVCMKNNGAGIALIGDLASKGAKWRAYHWVLENNQLNGNRWGIYAKHADWVAMGGNRFEDNEVQDILTEDVTRLIESKSDALTTVALSNAMIEGPASVAVGQRSTWTGTVTAETGTARPVFTWDIGDGMFRTGNQLTHAFDRNGFHRMGFNVTDGHHTEVAWQDIYVVKQGVEIGSEGQANEWSLEDLDVNGRIGPQVSKAEFWNEPKVRLVGQSSLGVVIRPYGGFRASLHVPIKDLANGSLKGKTKLTFWLKSINEDATGWQGGPFVTLSEGTKSYRIEPKEERDLMRESPYS
ncbi:MAG: right-handed parallel beta-helix repeat-containing protein, partial [Pirellula sp.]